MLLVNKMVVLIFIVVGEEDFVRSFVKILFLFEEVVLLVVSNLMMIWLFVFFNNVVFKIGLGVEFCFEDWLFYKDLFDMIFINLY